MIQHKFKQFIDFGSVADADGRKKLAETVYGRLESGKDDGGFSPVDSGNFADTLELILGSSKTMRNLCAKDARLAELVAQETLNFINRTKRQNRLHLCAQTRRKTVPLPQKDFRF